MKRSTSADNIFGLYVARNAQLHRMSDYHSTYQLPRLRIWGALPPPLICCQASVFG